MDKPSLPKGTRDFGPAQMAKRQFIMEGIRTVFQKYGFMPLETPAMENLETLTGKYGEEGDKLLFRILDSGDYFEKFLTKTFLEERSVRISTFLLDFLKEVCIEFSRIRDRTADSTAFGAIPGAFTELVSAIQESYPRLSHSTTAGAYLDDADSELVKKYVQSKSQYVAYTVVMFFQQANLNVKSRFEQNFDFHFGQFRDTIFTEEILSDFHRFAGIETLISKSSRETTRDISEKGLRYDLTVPFARYVVMNRNDFSLPFKRYQMQPVWRADRPQKGRYREFYQCDADVVGTDSLICEAEIILMITEIFKSINVDDYTIKINHRGILSGLAEASGASDESVLFVGIDKLDKIGEGKVREELQGKGFSAKSLDTVFNVLNFKGDSKQKFAFLQDQFKQSQSGQKGLNDVKEVFDLLSGYGLLTDHVDFDLSLARGLSYYTGCIFEVKINGVAIGSVSGGGRYDNLTQSFGSKEKLSGVGISFGIDRIYDAMEELNAFPTDATRSTTVLICHFDKESMLHGLAILNALRARGIASEIYPDLKKIDKQLDYANNKHIPFAIIIGSEEIKSGLYSLKDLRKGEQMKLGVDGIMAHLASNQ